jgi:protein-S-isoprenylcysteine O-methyltransferase Ste14
MKAASKFVVLCWIITGVIWVISALSVKPTKERQPIFGRLIYLWITVVVVVLLIGAIRRFDLSGAILPHTLGIAVLADLIVLAGFVIAVWARLVLGGNWSSRVVLKENHELIQRGPYHFVRHPIYSGLLLMVLGTVVLAGTLGAFVALLICSCAFWIKLRQEEALLTKRLPGYSEYKARTKALIPLVF